MLLVIDTETSRPSETATILDWDVIDARSAEMGATTETDKAALLGCGRATLYRWRSGAVDIGLARAAEVASRLGLDLAQIVAAGKPRPSPPPPQPRPPAGPGDPRPPAGPKTRQP